MTRRRRPRTPRRAPKPRTLRTRLVVASVVLIAVVCAVIGTVTTVALRSHLYEQLDGQLGEVAARATGKFTPPGGGPDDAGGQGGAVGRKPQRVDITEFVARGPQPSYTIAAKVENGGITEAKYGDKSTQDLTMSAASLDAAQIIALGSVPQDGEEHTVGIPGLGDYRGVYQEGPNGAFYLAIPTADVDNTINTLILVEVSVTAAGLLAASLAGTIIVGVATRPLRTGHRHRHRAFRQFRRHPARRTQRTGARVATRRRPGTARSDAAAPAQPHAGRRRIGSSPAVRSPP
ncbi:hypothetical protein SFUMM280S_01200 [Streptomyces fumanus]